MRFAISFALCFGLSAAAGAPAPCTADLEVHSREIHRMSGVSRVYEFKTAPSSRVRLEVTLTETTLAELTRLGIRRRSNAARALGFAGPLDTALARPVRLAYLQFTPPASEAVRHQAPLLGPRSVRDAYPEDFAAREALVKEMVADLGTRNTAYVLSFVSEGLLWREFEELAHFGPTRFATKSWLAGVLRPLGVRGATMVAGEFPPEVGSPAQGPYRYPLATARQAGWGPQILLFQPARR